MSHANARPVTTFFVLACACGVYMGLVLWASSSVGFEEGTTRYPVLHQVLVLLVPVVVCGAVQFRRSKRAAVSGLRLWFHVAGVAIGAPLVGMWLALAFIFALFGRAP
jgi:hypothetical protein